MTPYSNPHYAHEKLTDYKHISSIRLQIDHMLRILTNKTNRRDIVGYSK